MAKRQKLKTSTEGVETALKLEAAPEKVEEPAKLTIVEVSTKPAIDLGPILSSWKQKLLSLKTKRVSLPRLRRPQIPQIKHKRLLVLSGLFVLIVGLFMFTIWSKPGDLLFFPRQLGENLYSKSSPEVARLARLDNRLWAYSLLQSQANCVQLALASESLTTELRNNVNTDRFSDSDPKFLRQLIDMPLPRTSDCETKLHIYEIKVLALQAIVPTDLTQSEELSLGQAKLAAIFKQIQAQSRDIEFKSQTELDDFTSMIVEYKQLATKPTPINIYAAELALQNAQNALDAKQSLNFEDMTDTICLFLNNSDCSRSILASKWNSVHQLPKLQDQFAAGYKLVTTYWEKLNPSV